MTEWNGAGERTGATGGSSSRRRSGRRTRRSAAELPEPIDLVVTSPTELARQAAASAVGDRWVFTLEEPLLAPRASGESGGDVLARFAQALRGVRARESSVSLVICDTLDLLGGSVFMFDEKGLMHVADALDQLPLLDHTTGGWSMWIEVVTAVDGTPTGHERTRYSPSDKSRPPWASSTELGTHPTVSELLAVAPKSGKEMLERKPKQKFAPKTTPQRSH